MVVAVTGPTLRVPGILRGPYVRSDAGTVVLRNDSNSQNDTVNLFLANLDTSWEYAASIVGACADQTTYALQCTSGDYYVGTETCGPHANACPSTFAFTSSDVTSTMGHEFRNTVQEACNLKGSTEAVCTITVGNTVDGTSQIVTSTSTMGAGEIYRSNVQITAGADKIASATGTCGKNAAAGLNTRGAVLFGFLVTLGTTSLLAA
ncbi:hypothetical protein GQ53DRAFT_662066 [Thozetella sp. PMI_491]|nr:hypothetical protein GQ53DRAFT_662066 [Thozetella sp. PMI_491]